MLEGGGPPRRDIMHDPRPEGRWDQGVLGCEGIRAAGEQHRTKLLPGDDGQVLHYQRAVGVLDGVEHHQAMARPRHCRENQYPIRRWQERTPRTDPSRELARGSWWHVPLRRWMFFERLGPVESVCSCGEWKRTAVSLEHEV